MVSVGDEMLDEVTRRAKELLEAGLAAAFPVRLSRREEEVLSGVLQNLQNKEIAVRLSISERTVKAHVSSLLTKFNARNRLGLAEAVNLCLPRDLAVAAPSSAPVSADTRTRAAELPNRGDQRPATSPSLVSALRLLASA